MVKLALNKYEKLMLIKCKAHETNSMLNQANNRGAARFHVVGSVLKFYFYFVVTRNLVAGNNTYFEAPERLQ